MKYVIGIDGGGTKTLCAAASADGEVLKVYKIGCTNPYISGLEQTRAYIAEAVETLVNYLGVSPGDISNVYMGLAGADNESDIRLLKQAFDTTLLKELPYEIENDIWIAYKAKTVENVGAVSVCGTGHNTGVLAPGNRKVYINAYKYPLGNFGGGRMITDMALNDAFRSYEHTGDKTMLEDRLCGHCGYSSWQQLAEDIIKSGYTLQYDFSVPKLVVELAKEGDAVSRRILETAGWEQGRMTGGLIEKAGLCNARIPIVLSGTIYVTDDSGYLLNSYKESVKRFCPHSAIQLLDGEPVQGALINAIEHSNEGLDSEELYMISKRINETMTRYFMSEGEDSNV